MDLPCKKLLSLFSISKKCNSALSHKEKAVKQGKGLLMFLYKIIGNNY